MLLKIISTIVIIYVSLSLVLFIFQRKFIYFPDQRHPTPEQWQLSTMRVVHLNTRDGLQLEGWYQPAQKDYPTLLYFHGNAGHLGMRNTWVKSYLESGYGLLLLSYRGYAGNPGTPTEKGLYEDGRAALDYLEQQHVPRQCIVLFGESLGSGVAIQVATERQVGAMILQAPYTSLIDVAKAHYPIFPISLFLRDRFMSLSKINKIKVPLLILQGENDRIIPPVLGRRLFEKANGPKHIIIYPHVGHNDFVTEQMITDVKSFIGDNVTVKCGAKKLKN